MNDVDDNQDMVIRALPQRKKGQLWFFRKDKSMNLLLAKHDLVNASETWLATMSIGHGEDDRRFEYISFNKVNASNWELLEDC